MKIFQLGSVTFSQTCTDATPMYQLSVKNTLPSGLVLNGTLPSFIIYDSASNSFSVETNDQSLVGFYELEIKVTLLTAIAIGNIYLTIFGGCSLKPMIINNNQNLPVFTYKVG